MSSGVRGWMIKVVKSLKISVVKSSPSWKIRPNTSRLMDLPK